MPRRYSNLDLPVSLLSTPLKQPVEMVSDASINNVKIKITV
jgi:hypothetical protein